MDLTEKGWLPKYLEYREKTGHLYNPEKMDTGRYIYRLLQPTGLIFGHPLRLPDFVDLSLDEWPVKEKIKLIFTEGLLSVYKVSETKTHKTFPDFVTGFYAAVNPGLIKSSVPFPAPTTERLAEKAINKRIKVKAKWNINFWQGFFQNVLLFSDIIAAIDFAKNPKTEKPKRYIHRIRFDALKIIAATTFADGNLGREEVKLFKFFVESASLNKKRKEEALKLIDKNIEIKDITLSQDYEWMVRKYFLDLAILMVWADKNISKKEEEFIKDIAIKLGLNDDDLTGSLAGVESFVMKNWEKVHYLQQKQNYLIVSKRLTSRLTKTAEKYKNEIKKEIEESKELIALLNKSKHTPLTTEEKEIVRKQLVDILKIIPTFVFLTLPGSFFALPILLKILPKSVFPSSFDRNKLLRGNKKNIISG